MFTGSPSSLLSVILTVTSKPTRKFNIIFDYFLNNHIPVVQKYFERRKPLLYINILEYYPIRCAGHFSGFREIFSDLQYVDNDIFRPSSKRLQLDNPCKYGVINHTSRI